MADAGLITFASIVGTGLGAFATKVLEWRRQRRLVAGGALPAPPVEVHRDRVSSRILVIDDEPSLGPMLADWLGEEGYVVDHARTLAEARALRSVHSYEVSVVDLRLPDGDGTDFVREQREVWIGYSAHDEDVLNRTRASGAFDVVLPKDGVRGLLAALDRFRAVRRQASNPGRASVPPEADD